MDHFPPTNQQDWTPVTSSALGPCLAATITTDRVDACVEAWCTYLHHTIAWEQALSPGQAEQWGRPALAGCRTVWLKNAAGEPWLRFIQDNTAVPVEPFRHTGWLSLEVNVQNVEALHRDLLDSPFTIIGPPATLDVSADISAMQVVGPAGEVLYLTEIKKAVPGFDLPLARSAVDRLFIPVLLVSDRDAALATYEQFPNTGGNCFETRITVLNRAHELAPETRHPNRDHPAQRQEPDRSRRVSRPDTPPNRQLRTAYRHKHDQLCGSRGVPGGRPGGCLHLAGRAL